jgi:hypothetical protein
LHLIGELFVIPRSLIPAVIFEFSRRLASYSLVLLFSNPPRSNPLGDRGGVPYGEFKLDLSSSSLRASDLADSLKSSSFLSNLIWTLG